MVFVFRNQGLQGIFKDFFFLTQSIIYSLLRCNVITIDTEINFLEVQHAIIHSKKGFILDCIFIISEKTVFYRTQHRTGITRIRLYVLEWLGHFYRFSFCL